MPSSSSSSSRAKPRMDDLKDHRTEVRAKDLVIEILSREAESNKSTENSFDGNDDDEDDVRTAEEEEKVVQALAARSYHLPGNGYCMDWTQYMTNNHLVFGLCCRHRLHPIGFRMRLIALLGSALFGLLVTSVVWLSYVYTDRDPYGVLFEVPLPPLGRQENTTTIPLLPDTTTSQASKSGIAEDGETFQVTRGMILLWTVGSIVHACYDSAIWYLTACACCLPGGSCCERLEKCRWVGSYLTITVVVLVAGSATFAALLRARLSSSGFDFLLGYVVEIIVSIFVYGPLISTILFTGCLGRSNVPILGGRPYEMRQCSRP